MLSSFFNLKVFSLIIICSLGFLSQKSHADDLTQFNNLVAAGDVKVAENFLNAHPTLALNPSQGCPSVIFTIQADPIQGASGIHWDMLKMLIRHGANMNANCLGNYDYSQLSNREYSFVANNRTPQSDNLLFFVLGDPAFSVSDVKALVSLGANLSITHQSYGRNAWSAVTQNGATAIPRPSTLEYQNNPNTLAKADYLIQKNVNPNQLDNQSCPSFYFSALLAPSLIQKLRQANANLGANCAILSPLSAIIPYWNFSPHDQFLQATKLLVQAGADINHQNAQGESDYWQFLRTSGGHTELLQYLTSLKPNLTLNLNHTSGLEALSKYLACSSSSCGDQWLDPALLLNLIKSFFEQGENDLQACFHLLNLVSVSSVGTQASAETLATQVYEFFASKGLRGDLYDSFAGKATDSFLMRTLPRFPALAREMIENSADPKAIIHVSNIWESEFPGGDFTPIVTAFHDPSLIQTLQTWNLPEIAFTQNITGGYLRLDVLKNLSATGYDPGFTGANGTGQIYFASQKTPARGQLDPIYFATIQFVAEHTHLPINVHVPPSLDVGLLYSTLLENLYLYSSISDLPHFSNELDLFQQASAPMDWNLTNSDGKNILYRIVQAPFDQQNLFKRLSDLGADAKLITFKGQNLFFSLKDSAWVPYLQSLGLNVNLQDSNGTSPLMQMAIQCSSIYSQRSDVTLDVMKALVLVGANPNLKDHQGKRAVDLLNSTGGPRCLQTLQYLQSFP